MKKYTHEMSQRLFMDIWEKYGYKKEIFNKEEIYNFLNDIVIESKGLVILDHFSNINFDNLEKIEYKEPYMNFHWRNHEEYRKKYINKTLSEFEMLEWGIWGYSTYSYIMMDIKKIRVVNKKGHLFILLHPNLTTSKNIEKTLIGSNNTLISKENNKDELYTQYMFWEGNVQDCIKHICTVSNLPYYVCLLQPKEGCTPNSNVSKELLLIATFGEINERIDKVYNSINQIDEYEYDELFSKGNTIRRIIEYTLKYLCIYKKIEIKGKDLEDNYGDILLGALKKTINTTFEELNINQSFINIANELSHDSGEIFSKDEILEFCNDAKLLVDEIQKIIFKKRTL